MRARPLLLPATILLSVALSGAIAWRSMKRDPESPRAPLETEDSGVIAWCAPELQAIPGEGCFAGAREPASGSAPLLIYLHGMYEEGKEPEELDRQGRVARHATSRGFAVLAMRGRLGQCIGKPTWFCWPSNERTATDAPSVVSGFGAALQAAQSRGGSGKRYVLGFSNGAFFAGLLAVRALFSAEAFAIFAGGPVQPVHAEGAKPPLLLLSGDDDLSQEGMILFDRQLTQENWAHESYARAGGHMLTDGDIDAALTFFIRTRTEKLPLVPPLPLHKPHLRAPDASADDASPAADASGIGQDTPDANNEDVP